ncbi:hemojuvelin isoform 1-T3 [Discoglossus pictus]
MGTPANSHHLPKLFDCVLLMTALLISCEQVDAHCKIVKCNSEYLSATSDLRGPSKNAAYCNALRAYSHCTRKTARTCRGDLIYHSAVHIIEDLMIQHNCTKDGPTVSPRPQPPQPPPEGPRKQEACDYEKVFQEKHKKEPRYLHCGVFGDPHVRTFSGDFQTCRVNGSWPLLDNDYLFVQATSSPLSSLSNATVITKLTIIFKNMKQCIDQKVYQAEIGNLPAAFNDGSVNGDRRAGGRSLTIHEREPGSHIEIQAGYIGTTIRVRQLGHQLSFSIRTAEDISQAFQEEQDLQLCVGGCPASQWISRTKHIGSLTPISAEDAKSLCREKLPIEDVYFQSCVFDLMVSGDANLTSSAYHALEDAKDFHPEPGTLHIFSIGARGQHIWVTLLFLLSSTTVLWNM